MTTSFKDLFSSQASAYATYRPTYPDELYHFLSGLTQEHDLAWDCATGNGQAAAGLAPHYKHVLATDASERQLAQSPNLANVEYKISRAEESPLASGTADLITVAQAAHWFDLPRFFAEADRVLKPGGVLALWGYRRKNMMDVDSIDSIINHYTDHTLGSYWAPEIRTLTEGYQNFHFPFREIAAPKFKIETEWTLDQLLGYLYSWSATQNYIQETGENPIDRLRELIEPRWGKKGSARPVTFKLHFRIGRKEG